MTREATRPRLRARAAWDDPRERGEGTVSDVGADGVAGLVVNDHDAVRDEADRVTCRCGREFDGPKARDDHAVHFNIERARAALRGKENDGA